MENTPIDRLLHDYISGRISPEGMQELEAWSRESEENRQILDLIDGNSDLGSELSRMYRYDKERVWQAICEEDRRYMRRKRLFRTLRACAAVLLLVGVFVSGALLYEARERLDSNRNHLPTTVEPGTRRAVLELSSGEVVALSDTLRTELRERNMRIEIDGDRIAYDLHIYDWADGAWTDCGVTLDACAQKALGEVETDYDAASGRFTLSYGSTSAVYQVPAQYRSDPGGLTLGTCFFREQDGVFTVVLGARLDTTGTLFANILATIDFQGGDFTLRDIRVEPTTVV